MSRHSSSASDVADVVVTVPRPGASRADETRVEVPVQIAGPLRPGADNVVLVAHDFHHDHRAAGPHGWWNGMIGEERVLDTSRYTVISPAYVSSESATGPGGEDPGLRVADLADGIVAVLDAMDVPALHAVVGGGSGGLVALTLATRYPDRMRRLISIASGARVTTLQSMHLAHQIAALDLAGDDPERLELAWRISTVRRGSLAALEAAANSSAVEDIDRHLGESSRRYWKGASPHSLKELLWAWRHFDVARDSSSPSADAALTRLGEMPVLVLGIDSDTLFYPAEQAHLMDLLRSAGVPARRYTFHSGHGHDGWLDEPNVYGSLVREALA